MSGGLAGLLAEVAALSPVDGREEGSIARILELAPALARPFDEEADPTHLTASAFILGSRGTVLHLHRRLGIWVQPGGHVDEGEAPLAAALREAAEETGLPVEPASPEGPLLHVDVHPGPRGHLHLDLRYVLLAPRLDPAPPPEESQDVRWLGFAEARELAEPGLRGGLAKLEAYALGSGLGWRERVERMDDEARRP